MKIGIVYATKTGTTEEAARQLAEALEARGHQTTLSDLARNKPDLSADAYALGGSIRIGRWHGRAKRFARAHEDALLNKPLALFACRCGEEDLRVLLAKQIGEKLVSHAVFADGLGGTMDPEKQKGPDRWIVRMVQKSENSAKHLHSPGVVRERVEACADALCGALTP